MEKEHVLLLIHGIRTQGSWAEMISAIFARDEKIKVQPIRYGFFDTIKFLSPFWTREAPIRRIIQEYRDTKRKFPNAKISAIAHSFGTYALVKSLREPDVEFHKVILCGSIVPESFRAADHRAQITFDPILNDCGTHDIWPPLARAVTWGYGATGTFGFGTVGVRDRFNKFSHSQYFSKDFVEKYWRPYIVEGIVVPTEWEEERGTPPYWQSLLSILPLKWIFLLVTAALAYFAWTSYEKSRTATIDFIPPFIVGHLVGAAEVGASVSLSNNRSDNAEFSGISAQLVGPQQQVIPLDHYGVLVGSSLQPPLPIIMIPPGASQAWSLSFRGNFSAQQPMLMQIQRYVTEEGIIVNSWDPSKSFLPDGMLTNITSVANEKFPWTTGTWIFTMNYLLNGSPQSQTVNFDVSQSDIERMKSSIPHYSSGLGIFPAWQYFGPDGMSTMRSMNLK